MAYLNLPLILLKELTKKSLYLRQLITFIYSAAPFCAWPYFLITTGFCKKIAFMQNGHSICFSYEEILCFFLFICPICDVEKILKPEIFLTSFDRRNLSWKSILIIHCRCDIDGKYSDRSNRRFAKLLFNDENPHKHLWSRKLRLTLHYIVINY